MEQVRRLIEEYQTADPPPFGIVAPVSGCLDELTTVAPINVALQNAFIGDEISIILDFGFWLWLATTTRKDPLEKSDRDLLIRMFGSSLLTECVQPLVGTITDGGREFKLWRVPPILPRTSLESVNDDSQKPVLSVHARTYKTDEITPIIKTLVTRCRVQWGDAFQILHPSGILHGT